MHFPSLSRKLCTCKFNLNPYFKKDSCQLSRSFSALMKTCEYSSKDLERIIRSLFLLIKLTVNNRAAYHFRSPLVSRYCGSIWGSSYMETELGYLLDSVRRKLNFSRTIRHIAGRSGRSFPSEALRKRTGDTRLAALTWIKRLSFSRRWRIRSGRGKVAMRESWAGGRAKLPPLGGDLEETKGHTTGDARAAEKEKKADFLVDYKRFTPRVTKAFTEGDIIHVVEDDRSHSLVAPAGTSEFLTTPSDGHSEDRQSLATVEFHPATPLSLSLSCVFYSLKLCE